MRTVHTARCWQYSDKRDRYGPCCPRVCPIQGDTHETSKFCPQTCTKASSPLALWKVLDSIQRGGRPGSGRRAQGMVLEQVKSERTQGCVVLLSDTGATRHLHVVKFKWIKIAYN